MQVRMRPRASWQAVVVLLVLAAAATAQEYRTADGYGNNVKNPTWGQSGTPFLRVTAHAYPDNNGTVMARDSAPPPRDISNRILSRRTGKGTHPVTDFAVAWGQFVDHDVTLSTSGGPPLKFTSVASEVVFASSHEHFFARTNFVYQDGVRQQINTISHFIDASTVYGETEPKTIALRAMRDGLMRVSEDGKRLPLNDAEHDGVLGMQNPTKGRDRTRLYACGDFRCNENPLLLSMHTLFVLEHNTRVRKLKTRHPDWDDEKLFQEGRKWVIALIQHITFNEFLPAILGPDHVDPYPGYDPDVNPSNMALFSGASFRYGHSEVNSLVVRLDSSMREIPQGHMLMRDSYFNPNAIEEGGIEAILRGMTVQPVMDVDTSVVDDLRNFLFPTSEASGGHGEDLTSLNIMRGRDHGLCHYNDCREQLGLRRKTSYHDVTGEDPSNLSSGTAVDLATVYGPWTDDKELDPWVLAMAEPKLPSSNLGELNHHVIKMQFQRFRSGDRFWFENDGVLTPSELREVRGTLLSDVIRRSTDVGGELQDRVFDLRQPWSTTLLVALVGAAMLLLGGAAGMMHGASYQKAQAAKSGKAD